MADTLKVAPLTPGAGAVTGTPEYEKYQEALDQSLKALETRMNPQTNWWNLAAAFAKPTRTGGFGESLGNANEAMGKEQEREQQEALPIAQMRAQLAGQKYEMANKEKGYKIFSDAMGFQSPAEAANALQSGRGLVGLSNKYTPELYTLMSRYDPKLAETVKNAAAMDVDRFKAINEAAKTNVDITKLYQQYGKEAVDYFMNMNGSSIPTSNSPATSKSVSSATPAKPEGQYDFSPIASGATLTSPMGERNGKEHQGIDLGGMKQGAPVTTPVAGEVVFAGDNGSAGNMVTVRGEDGNLHSFMHFDKLNVKVGDKVDPSTVIGAAGQTGNATGVHVHYEAKTPDGKPVNVMDRFKANQATPTASTETAGGAPQFGYKEISPDRFKLQYSGREVVFPQGESPERKRDILAKAVETEQQIYKQAVEAEAKPWQEKQTELMKYDNYATEQNLNRTDTILKLLNKNPQVVGLLQNEETRDVFSNFIKGLGAASQEGIKAGNFGQFSLPVEKYLSTANLNKDERKALAELTRHISQEFLAGMKANKGLLGVNPTDNDARLFQAAQSSTSNLAENIYSWAQGRAAEYETMNKMYKGYVDTRQKFGGADPAAYFIRPDSPYHSAVKDYAKVIGKITDQSPGVQ